MRIQSIILAALLLAACHSQPSASTPAARIALDQVGQDGSDQYVSPDTTGAGWQADGAQRIGFSLPGKPAWLTLACEQPDPAAAPNIRFIRHAPADPGAKALFAVIGNGRIARLKIDAIRDGKSWHWEGAVPVDDPRLDVLKGPNRIEATLPGAGTLKLNASSMPGQLLAECRRFLPPELAKPPG